MRPVCWKLLLTVNQKWSKKNVYIYWKVSSECVLYHGSMYNISQPCSNNIKHIIFNEWKFVNCAGFLRMFVVLVACAGLTRNKIKGEEKRKLLVYYGILWFLAWPSFHSDGLKRFACKDTKFYCLPYQFEYTGIFLLYP